ASCSSHPTSCPVRPGTDSRRPCRRPSRPTSYRAAPPGRDTARPDSSFVVLHLERPEPLGLEDDLLRLHQPADRLVELPPEPAVSRSRRLLKRGPDPHAKTLVIDPQLDAVLLAAGDLDDDVAGVTTRAPLTG